MTSQLERSPTERLWSEYRRKDGMVIRRVLPAPRSRIPPRTIATIRASRFDAGLLALLFGISEDMVKSIRSGRRLARLGRGCTPIPDSKLLSETLALFRIPRGSER